MSTLTDAQVVLLAEAGVLIRTHASAMSELEQETVADVASRFGRFQRNAIVTPREWALFYQGVEAMRAAELRVNVARARFLARTRAA